MWEEHEPSSWWAGPAAELRWAGVTWSSQDTSHKLDFNGHFRAKLIKVRWNQSGSVMGDVKVAPQNIFLAIHALTWQGLTAESSETKEP